MNTADLFRRMAELSASGTPFAHLLVAGVQGSSPRAVGASMVVLSDGSTLGTIGGGVLEWRATEDALRHLREGTSSTETYQLTKSGEHALDARCGGEVQVFFDIHSARESLVIIGAGHIGQQLCALAGLLDYRIVVIDSRQDMVTHERLPAASEVFCSPDGWMPEMCTMTPSTSVVVVTHSAEHDRDALRAVLTTDAQYVGLMGSKRKIASVFRELEAEGVSRTALDRVHAPVGLQIGAETPAELALCIMAEIVASRERRIAPSEEPAPADRADSGKEPAPHD
jgi:xanthine dehydrogenase accessory factor